MMLKTRRSNEINKISHCLECLSWKGYFALTSLDRVSNCKHTGVNREATFADESTSLLNSNFSVGMLEGCLLEVDAVKFLYLIQGVSDTRLMMCAVCL